MCHFERTRNLVRRRPSVSRGEIHVLRADARCRRRLKRLEMSASDPLGWARGIRGRADVAPGRVDIVANLAERLAFGSHGHHGTRDVNADPSAIAHRIEQHRAVVPDLLHIAACVRCVPPLPAAAEAGHPLQEILVGDRKAVVLLNSRRGLVELLRPAILGWPRQQRVVRAAAADDWRASHERQTAGRQRHLQPVPPGQSAWFWRGNTMQGGLQMVSDQSAVIPSRVHRTETNTPNCSWNDRTQSPRPRSMTRDPSPASHPETSSLRARRLWHTTTINRNEPRMKFSQKGLSWNVP